MKETNKLFAEDLIKTVLHPDRVFDRINRGMEFDDVVQEDFGKYSLPPGKEIIMEDDIGLPAKKKPRFASYDTM